MTQKKTEIKELLSEHKTGKEMIKVRIQFLKIKLEKILKTIPIAGTLIRPENC